VADVPETHYAKTDDCVHIAYQIVGNGPFDLVLVPGFVSNVEHYWEMPVVAEMLGQLASFSRLILFDKRGTGLSDPVTEVPPLEQRMDDLKTVLDAADSRESALFGISEGGPMSLLFAATYPERTRAVALYGTTPRFLRTEGIDWGWSPRHLGTWLAEIEDDWGRGALLKAFAPSFANDERVRAMWGRFQRAGASPAMARAVVEAWAELDARPILEAVHVPTLIVHRTGERIAPVGGARYMAERIPDAKLVELPGEDHLPFVGDWHGIIDEVEEFLTGTRATSRPERVLATVLFTDIVDSTTQAADLGDRAWRETLERHDALVRRQLDRFRGREIKQTGDGFLAMFDGPGRAVDCAVAVTKGAPSIGVEVRAGVHTGECEVRGEDLGGLAVHIGARIAAAAGPGEVLTSGTVKDLVVGSGLRFIDRGEHELKGVPDRWRLFAVEA
jgi:pimeloyl-ACP methyl ester carboxylesterase